MAVNFVAPYTERANCEQRASRQRPPRPPPCRMDLARDPLEIILQCGR